jgi:[protein-PII] uridylyltransferase
MTDLAEVREHYKAGKAALLASLAASGASSRGIHSLLQKLARHTDATLQTLWEHAGFPAAACLVAAGGFGRGELFPHSDVDVLLLLPDNTDVDADPASRPRSSVLSAPAGTWAWKSAPACAPPPAASRKPPRT